MDSEKGFDPRLATDSPIRAATKGRCPRCGRGRLFNGYLTIVDSCEVCHLKLGGADSADGPAVLIILFLGFFIAAGAAWLELGFSPPIWVHVVVWPPVITILSLLCLRPLKGAFIGIQFKYRSVEEPAPPEAP